MADLPEESRTVTQIKRNVHIPELAAGAKIIDDPLVAEIAQLVQRPRPASWTNCRVRMSLIVDYIKP